MSAWAVGRWVSEAKILSLHLSSSSVPGGLSLQVYKSHGSSGLLGVNFP